MNNLSPCPRCLALADEGIIDLISVGWLTNDLMDALARDDSGPCCQDCATADAVGNTRAFDGFEPARIAVAKDRKESLENPSHHCGLILHGWMRPSVGGDLRKRTKLIEKNLKNWRRRIHGTNNDGHDANNPSGR